MTVVIGITGGIASGKSTACEHLRELGAAVINADKVGHSCYEPGSAGLKEVVAEFGEGVVHEDGTLNRKALGSIVFSSKEQLHKLNGIMWPKIKTAISAKLEQLRRNEQAVVVIEAAVLVEARWTDLCDEVWLVMTSPEVALTRLMARNKLPREAAQARLDSQAATAELRRVSSTRIFLNNGSAEELMIKLVQAWGELVRLFGLPALDGGEMVTIVDKDNNVVSSAPRSRMREENLLHRASYIFVKNSAGDFYVHKRTMLKDAYPGMYGVVFGGIVAVGESEEENAYRELAEELGVRDTPLKHLFTFFWSGDEGRVFGDAWEAVYDGEVRPQPEEVASVTMMSLEDIERAATSSRLQFTPDSLHAMYLYKKHKGIRTHPHQMHKRRSRSLLLGGALLAAAAARLLLRKR